MPKAVWDRRGSIVLHESDENSGGNSAVYPIEGKSVEVPATTIDEIADLFGRIDYIKMDIEGAERKAPAGARQTLPKQRPRLAIEAYHLPDDGHVLPSIILASNPAYVVNCGHCGIMKDKVVPYILYAR